MQSGGARSVILPDVRMQKPADCSNCNKNDISVGQITGRQISKLEQAFVESMYDAKRDGSVVGEK